MVKKMFKENQRRTIVQHLLEERGALTVEKLEAACRSQGLVLPFIENGDNSLHDWLMTIDQVKFRTVDGVEEYFIPEADALSNDTSHIRISSPELGDNPIAPVEVKPADPPKPEKIHQKPFKKPKYKTVPNLYGVELFGDHNFLNLALFDFQCEKTGHKRRQSGNCVSGLRIREATKRIYEMERSSDEPDKKILVNIGSVDVAEGRQLIEMMEDMKKFIKACEVMNVVPILTTLTPFPESVDRWSIHFKNEIIKGFNVFICRFLTERYAAIDLHQCMLGRDAHANPKFYLGDGEPRYISGCKRRLFLWNQNGRRQVRNMLRKNLGHALLAGRHYVGRYI